MIRDHETAEGFTLVELLTVIAIVAVLAALLLSVFGAARKRSQKATCINNLRQINLGVRMYSDDSNDNSPAGARTNSVDVFSVYKQLTKSYVGLKGVSSS